MRSTANSSLGSQPIQNSEPGQGRWRNTQGPHRYWSAWKTWRGAHYLLLGRAEKLNPVAVCIPEERNGGSDSETDCATRQSCQRGIPQMKRHIFEELLGSVREAGAIMRGQQRASRRTRISTPGVRVVRERTSLSQSEFAQLIGVSVKTLQNWEQQRRRPTGPAAALLRIIEHDPELAVRAIHRV